MVLAPIVAVVCALAATYGTMGSLAESKSGFPDDTFMQSSDRESIHQAA
jgi:hypothetical protein